MQNIRLQESQISFLHEVQFLILMKVKKEMDVYHSKMQDLYSILETKTEELKTIHLKRELRKVRRQK